MEEDLRICLVRPLTEGDRRFCFEVITLPPGHWITQSPDHLSPVHQVISPTKSHVLQADSEEMYGVWLTSLQQGISSSLHHMMQVATRLLGYLATWSHGHLAA